MMGLINSTQYAFADYIVPNLYNTSYGPINDPVKRLCASVLSKEQSSDWALELSRPIQERVQP